MMVLFLYTVGVLFMTAYSAEGYEGAEKVPWWFHPITGLIWPFVVAYAVYLALVKTLRG